jgi:peptide-methionine (R)-S-oxide reductase
MKIKKIVKYTALLVLLVGGYLLITNLWIDPGYSAHKQIKMNQSDTTMTENKDTYEVQKSKQEWREELTNDEYRILREKGTEMPFVNEYYRTEKEGVYVCAACGQELFTSKTKYHSGSGWPAFFAPIEQEAIDKKEDNSMFMTRTEVLCSKCGSHLGHVFEDGPEPTGLRYCINSVAMDLVEKDVE